jgi:integrase
LIEELWGETPPPTAAKTLQVHVSRLRGTLNGEGCSKDDGGPLETRGHGYVLRVEPRQLDAERFQRLLEEGRRALARGEARPAAEKIDEALGLRRGRALADFAYDEFAQKRSGVSLERLANAEGTEHLAIFLAAEWGEAADSTRSNRQAAVKSFFRWARETGRISMNPAAPLRSVRVKSRDRQAYGHDVILRLVQAQELRDACAIQLLALLGLRKNELRLLRIGDIDLVRNLVTVTRKGGKVQLLPLGFTELRDDLYCTSRARTESRASTCSIRAHTRRGRWTQRACIAGSSTASSGPAYRRP